MLLDSIETKTKILNKFLELAAFDGWNDQVLAQALEESGVDPKFQDLVFEGGCFELSQFYIEVQNQKTSELVKAISDFSGFKIRDKIRTILYLRFESEIQNKLALQRMTNFYFNPKNLLSTQYGPRPSIHSLANAYKIADFMWYEILDKSTDFNFYTKRLTLAKIILRTLSVFLKDESENIEKTKAFIDQEIDKVMAFEKRKSQIKNRALKAKDKLLEFSLNEEGLPKKPKEIIKDLPFIRLFKI